MLTHLKIYFRLTSWPIVAAMATLMVVSVLAVGAAEQAHPRELAGKTRSQVVWVVLAAAAFAGATLVHYQRIGRWAYALFGANLVLLVVVLFTAEDVAGVRRWLNLGPVQFQPSELAKVTYVLALAWYLRFRENYRRWRGLVLPLALTVVPFALILLEPSLGTSLLLFPTLLFMLFLAGARLKHLLASVATAACLALLPLPKDLSSAPPRQAGYLRSLAYWTSADGSQALVAAPLAHINTRQLSRIKGWLGQSDPQVAVNEGYQLNYSMIILSSAGPYGNRGEDMNLYYRALPEDHNDFIYAVIGGQWGLVGCLGVLALYLAIVLCGVEIAALTQDPFGRLVAVGVLAMLLVQMFINVAMTMGMMPITGVTLPLVSYGGSSMVASGLALGLLVNVGQRRPIVLARKSFEKTQEMLAPQMTE